MDNKLMKSLETQVAVDGFIATLKEIIDHGQADDKDAEIMKEFEEMIIPILEVAKMLYMMKVNVEAMGFTLDDKS